MPAHPSSPPPALTRSSAVNRCANAATPSSWISPTSLGAPVSGSRPRAPAATDVLAPPAVTAWPIGPASASSREAVTRQVDLCRWSPSTSPAPPPAPTSTKTTSLDSLDQPHRPIIPSRSLITTVNSCMRPFNGCAPGFRLDRPATSRKTLILVSVWCWPLPPRWVCVDLL